MNAPSTLTLEPKMQAAVDEIEALILQHYPTAQFSVGRDPEGSKAIHLTAIMDLDEPDEVLDLVLDRTVDLLVEDDLPIYVIPVRTPERRAAMHARTSVIGSALLPDESVHERIRRWLAEEGWQVRDNPDPNALFNLTVTLPDGRNINVAQLKSGPSMIIIVTGLTFPTEFYSDFQQLQPQAQRDMVWDVQRDLAMIGVESVGLSIPPTSLRYSVSVYLDGLTQDTLIQRFQLVSRALLLSVQTFIRGFERAGRPTSAAAGLLRLVHGNSARAAS
jgi:hypothetical protein